ISFAYGSWGGRSEGSSRWTLHDGPDAHGRLRAVARDRGGRDRGGRQDLSHPRSLARLLAASKSGIVCVAKSCEGERRIRVLRPAAKADGYRLTAERASAGRYDVAGSRPRTD